MNLGAISLGALVAAIVLSCTTRINVGLVAIAFAWIIGVYLGGMPVKEVTAGFPVDLFLTLAGVTLLFTQAQVNGTLGWLVKRVLRLARARAALLAPVFFVLAAALASIGPGNIATAALLAPVAMTTARQSGVPLFLMAILVGNGANAGSLSPFAPTGIIVNGLMARIGLTGLEASTYWNNFAAHAVMAFGGYLLFGGLRVRGTGATIDSGEPAEAFSRRHGITLTVITVLVVGVLVLRIHVGMAAFAGAVLLSVARAADDSEAIRRMPWGTIMLVSGVTVLVSLLEKTNGMDLFTGFITRWATQDTIAPVIAFVTGGISVYSSTSGVVLPAFLPSIPGLIEKMGGGDPARIASAMNIGSHLVDVSPLSTIGALCVASAGGGEEGRALFNRMLAWGLAMTVGGAAYCWVVF